MSSKKETNPHDKALELYAVVSETRTAYHEAHAAGAKDVAEKEKAYHDAAEAYTSYKKSDEFVNYKPSAGEDSGIKVAHVKDEHTNTMKKVLVKEAEEPADEEAKEEVKKDTKKKK